MRRTVVLAVGVVNILVLGIVAAIATPPRDATRTDIARALMTGGGDVKIESGKETTVHHVTIAPGGSSGWHSHPDAGVFMVMSGTMTNYGLDGAACESVDVPAGQAYFVPPHAHHAHLALNKGSEPLELTVVYFNVPPGQPSRTDADAPAECPADLR
ncbi:MAG TPA: cupin domain-containing protein [Acidimicrobiia bacterium]|jgi:mannose-6-phosphate isomerase-like protein (cupin superfamily)